MSDLYRRFKITVCADGFVSVMEKKSDRRLGSALVCYSTDTIEEAMILISEVCMWSRCVHGGETGTTIEPRAIEWPRDDAGISDINRLRDRFREAHARMCETDEKIPAVIAAGLDGHDLYKTGDTDAPSQIKDANGEVVLCLCRRCGKAEAELTGTPCRPPGKSKERASPTGLCGSQLESFEFQSTPPQK